MFSSTPDNDSPKTDLSEEKSFLIIEKKPKQANKQTSLFLNDVTALLLSQFLV